MTEAAFEEIDNQRKEDLKKSDKGKFASEKFLQEHRISFDVSPNVPRWKRDFEKGVIEK